MSDEKTVVEYLAGGVITILSGIGIYHSKKIAEIPEKYMPKEDFNIFKKEIREDFNITKKEIREDIKESIKGVHDRLDKLFEPK